MTHRSREWSAYFSKNRQSGCEHPSLRDATLTLHRFDSGISLVSKDRFLELLYLFIIRAVEIVFGFFLFKYLYLGDLPWKWFKYGEGCLLKFSCVRAPTPSSWAHVHGAASNFCFVLLVFSELFDLRLGFYRRPVQGLRSKCCLCVISFSVLGLTHPFKVLFFCSLQRITKAKGSL